MHELVPWSGLIILARHHVIVELGKPYLSSFATPVVPELGGKGRRKSPSLKSSKVPTRSTHTLVRDNSRYCRRKFPPNIGFPLPWGRGGEQHSHKWLPSIAPPVASYMSRSAASCFRLRFIRKIRPVLSSCGLHGHGDAVNIVPSRYKPSTPSGAYYRRWGVPTRGEVGRKR
jgi:hypothetical protein